MNGPPEETTQDPATGNGQQETNRPPLTALLAISEDGIIGIGSGGNYALAAAKVLMDTDTAAEDIAKKAIKVASEICVFTNDNLSMEKI